MNNQRPSQLYSINASLAKACRIKQSSFIRGDQSQDMNARQTAGIPGALVSVVDADTVVHEEAGIDALVR